MNTITLATTTEIGTITPVSWTPPPGGLSYEQWEAIGYTLQEMNGSIAWWLGDHLNYGEVAYGEKYAQVVEATGWRVGRLKDYCWVARNVLPDNRRERLSWTHHRHVAHLPAEAQDTWLELAETRDLSSAELRHALAENGADRPVLGAISIHPFEVITPPEIIDSAHRMYGGTIDLDPASSPLANETVGADHYYCPPDDGLVMPWFGRVWLHPPGGWSGDNTSHAIWAGRARAAHMAQAVDEILLLVDAVTGEAWFQELLSERPVCFVEGRPSAVFYFGDRDGMFEKTFSSVGVVL